MYCISVVLVIQVLLREHHEHFVTDVTDVTHYEGVRFSYI